MNNTKKLRSALLSSLTIIASIVLGHTAQAQVNIYFEPKGGKLDNLDNDPILDISTTHNHIIDFEIFIETKGLDNNIRIFSYLVDFDPGELKYENSTGLVRTHLPPNNGSFRISGDKLDIAKNGKQLITTIRFTAKKALNNDGIFDFRISESSGRYENNVGGIPPDSFRYGPDLDKFWQQVEVQEGGVPGTPEPTSILGLFSLGILGAGATIKRQVKRNHSIEKETTKIG
jgi:hypothetical protein